MGPKGINILLRKEKCYLYHLIFEMCKQNEKKKKIHYILMYGLCFVKSSISVVSV